MILKNLVLPFHFQIFLLTVWKRAQERNVLEIQTSEKKRSCLS